jgi:hypothetical protein
VKVPSVNHDRLVRALAQILKAAGLTVDRLHELL